MVKLRSRKENENASSVLSDKTNVTNIQVTKKSVKPLKPLKNAVSKPLTAKNNNLTNSPVLRSSPLLASSDDDQNNENICTNVSLKKKPSTFNTPAARNEIPIVPDSDKGKHAHSKPMKKIAKVNKISGTKSEPKSGTVSQDVDKIVKNTCASKPLEKCDNSFKKPIIASNNPVPSIGSCSSDEDVNNEKACSSMALGKNDNSFKKPILSNLVSTKSNLNKPEPPSTKSRRKTKDNINARKLVSKIVPVSKSTKGKIIRKPASSSVKSLLPNYFGFDDSDLETDHSPCKTELSKFDPSKPYRLALYVKPSRTIRINPALARRIQSLHPSLNLTNYSIMDNSVAVRQNVCSDSMMSPNRTEFKVPFASTPLPVKKTAAKLVQKKITDVIQVSPKRTRAGNADRQFKSYFEKSLTSDEEASPPPKEVAKKRTSAELTASDSNDEIEETIIPVATFKKSRRSYVKKSKPLPEPMDEPPSDEVIKSIEKVKKKGKSKKAEREDEEFEKWSQSMNSMFSEVDQFEISFG